MAWLEMRTCPRPVWPPTLLKYHLDSIMLSDCKQKERTSLVSFRPHWASPNTLLMEVEVADAHRGLSVLISLPSSPELTGMLWGNGWSKLFAAPERFNQQARFSHTPSHTHTRTHAFFPFSQKAAEKRWHTAQRLVSSHVGSFMLFSTRLTTFSRSFRALCSSSSDRFIFLLSWEVKKTKNLNFM